MEKIHNNLSGLINKASEEAVSSFEEGYDISFAGEMGFWKLNHNFRYIETDSFKRIWNFE